MLSLVDFNEDGKVLDLGCGYGIAGILAARIIDPENVVMIDKIDSAVECWKENAALNGVPDIKVLQSD